MLRLHLVTSRLHMQSKQALVFAFVSFEELEKVGLFQLLELEEARDIGAVGAVVGVGTITGIADLDVDESIILN